MTRKERRRFKRHRCNIPAEYAIYASKIIAGKTAFKNISKGGLRFQMKRAPFVDTVIAIKVDSKRMARYVDFDRILLDPDGNPIVRVAHVTADKKNKVYNVGVRFLEKPLARAKENRIKHME